MQKPQILTEGQYDNEELGRLKEQPVWKLQDIFESQLTELFEITNAPLINTPEYESRLKEFISERSGDNANLKGNYVYYPWSGLLMHAVSKDEQNRLRTNRTHDLINDQEQQKLADFTAGVAGLSFGNGIALALVYAGASDTIKIADTDIFETTNLNRIRVGLTSVGIPKTEITARDIYEINPYADVRVFENGLNEDNLDDFINGDGKLNIVFDVVDDFSMKVRLRLAAKKAGIPVVMLTSLEDSVLVDVERFDLNPETEIFHGLLGPVTDDLLKKEMTEEDKARYAMMIVGPDSVSYRNLLSLSNVGRTLVSRPHLYSTVGIVCGLAGYILKRIALGEEMPGFRKLVRFNEVLDISPNSNDTPAAREELLARMMAGRDA